MSKVTIDEGATYEYLAHGLGVLIIGLFLGLVNPLLTILFIIAGIAVMAIRTGIEIDLEKGLMRKCKKSLFMRFGGWIDLQKIVRAELKYNTNGPDISEGLQVTAPYILPVPRTAKTFDLILTNAEGKELVFNQFMKFGLAMKTLEALASVKHLEIINHFEQNLFEERAARAKERRK